MCCVLVLVIVWCCYRKIHAFIYDATVLEFNAGRDKDCELITVGKWYAMTGYGVGFPKGSPYMDEVNEIILNLQKEGELDRMVKFWLAGACHAKKEKKDKSSHNIGILNFTSAFILLAAGVLLGTSLLLLEHSYFKFGRKCLKKYDKTGCCSLVSLSMGKSLTFEQSVMDAIDYHRKHRCREPLCETQLWKARHELDLALIKIDRLREELTSLDTRGNEIKATRLNRNEDGRRPMEPNGNSLLHNRDSKADSIYEIPDSVRKIKTSNHFVVDIPVPFDSQEVSQEPVNETMRLNAPEKDVRELSDVDKRRLQFRRSPSYTNAMSVDSDGKESASSIKPSSIYGPVDKDRDGNTCDDAGAQISPLSTGNFNALSTNPTIIQAHAGRGGDKEFSPRRCPSYSQAVEDSPVFAPSSAASPDTNDKHNTRTRYYDGKYYVGVAGDNDESAL